MVIGQFKQSHHIRVPKFLTYIVFEKSNMSFGKFSSKVENIDTWDLHIWTYYPNCIKRILNYLIATTTPWERLNGVGNPIMKIRWSHDPLSS